MAKLQILQISCGRWPETVIPLGVALSIIYSIFFGQISSVCVLVLIIDILTNVLPSHGSAIAYKYYCICLAVSFQVFPFAVS